MNLMGSVYAIYNPAKPTNFHDRYWGYQVRFCASPRNDDDKKSNHKHKRLSARW